MLTIKTSAAPSGRAAVIRGEQRSNKTTVLVGFLSSFERMFIVSIKQDTDRRICRICSMPDITSEGRPAARVTEMRVPKRIKGDST